MSTSREKIVITGSSKGLGFELANRLSDAGHTVVGCGRTKMTQPVMDYSPVDLSDEGQVSQWAKGVCARHQNIDILINNAFQFGERMRFENLSDSQWHKVVDINLMGTFRVTRSFLPALKVGRNPLIVFVGSIMGKWARAGFSTYGVSKAATETLANVLAQELAPDGIKVATVYPSRIRTGLRIAGYGSNESLSSEPLENYLSLMEHLIRSRDSFPTGSCWFPDDIGL